ncbi:MAG: hypothetical protein II972_03350 [Elusimicrobiaceae bacterium]|nr:hypothetical protein [Elusimicrobiaceae bacterium]
MQNVYVTIMNLQSGILDNAGILYCLDRQIDTLLLNAKKEKVSIKDFIVANKTLILLF